MPTSAYYLRSLGLLRDLPEAAAKALEQRMVARSYERRQVVFPQGAPADSVHLLVEGTVELLLAHDGRETILLVLTPGELIGEPAVDASGTYPVQARALEDCVVCAIGRGDLEALVQVYPALAWRLLLWVGRTAEQAYARIDAMASCEVPDKLLALIRHLADRHGVRTHEGLEIALRLTHHELAALIGSCREAVSRGLKALRDQGLISVRSRHITLRTPA